MERVQLKSKTQIDSMRKAGQLAARTLEEVARRLEPGMTTDAIDQFVVQYTKQHGATCAPYGYHGFPRSLCTSLNEVVCHGIPGPRRLKEGDILNVDLTPILDGWHGDVSATFYIGEPSPDAVRVTEVARRCLALGIERARPGNRLGDIGAAIQGFAEGNGCSVVREFVGHGIGRGFHEPPSVEHFGRKGRGLRLRPGMTFTIEPMINLGNWPVRILDDDWTAVTADGSLSAQFEHTLVVTEDGPEILTAYSEPLPNSVPRPIP